MLTGAQFPPTEVRFVVMGEPATKSRARVAFNNGKPRAYTPEATKQAEANIKAEFLRQVGRLAPSGTHGFGVEAGFYLASGIRRDVDNMLKIVLDGLNKVAWADDHQVVEVIGRKSMVPKGNERTEIRIYVLGHMESRQATCAHCKTTFPRPPSHAAKKFCSDVCRKAARDALRETPCPWCGAIFIKVKKQKFCTAACGYDSRRKS